MDELIGEFLSYLKYERYRSQYTVENYGADITAFKEYAEIHCGNKSWETVDSDMIRAWMESMMDGGNKATSVNRRLSSLKSFFRFALARKLLDRDPAYRVKGPKREKVLPQYLREEEMDRLLDGECWDGSFADLRDRTIILMFYSTGMRLSELAGLDDNAVDMIQNQVKVHGKRNKDRLIPFGPELRETLVEYMRQRDAIYESADGALFVNSKGKRMQASGIRRQVIHHLSKVSTMKKKSPHVLRHTFATAMLNNDSGIESVQKLLGHERVTTTEIYTHTTFEQIRKVYAKTHPRGTDKECQSEGNENGPKGKQ